MDWIRRHHLLRFLRDPAETYTGIKAWCSDLPRERLYSRRIQGFAKSFRFIVVLSPRFPFCLLIISPLALTLHQLIS